MLRRLRVPPPSECSSPVLGVWRRRRPNAQRDGDLLWHLGVERSGDDTFARWSLFLVERMHRAGVPIAAGTDTPISFAAPGYSLHSELEMLVQAGLSPLEALRSATVRPAEFFGLASEMGTVEEGRLADLVLLSRNPSCAPNILPGRGNNFPKGLYSVS